MKKTKKKYIPKAQDGNYDLAPIDMPQVGYPKPPDTLYGDPQLQVKPYNPNMNSNLSFSDWTGLANGLAVGTTVIANSINSQKDFHKEQAKYYSELYGHPVQNNYTQNDNPIYTKYGGKMPYGGGPLTAEGAKEILRDGKVHGKPLTPKQKKYFGFIAGGGKPKAAYGYTDTPDDTKVKYRPELYTSFGGQAQQAFDEGWMPETSVNGQTIFTNRYNTTFNRVYEPKDGSYNNVALIGNDKGMFDIVMRDKNNKQIMNLAKGVGLNDVNNYFTNSSSTIANRNNSIKAENGYDVLGDPPPRKPIYTSDKNDPRLRAYNDSLTLYNAGRHASDILNKIKYGKDYEFLDANAVEKAYKRLNSPAYISEISKQLPYSQEDNTQVLDKARMFKKPVQPIQYQERRIPPKAILTDIPQFQLGYPSAGNITGNPTDFFSLPEGQPVYGPSSSMIGVYGKNGFVPDISNKANRTSVNQADSDLLNNPDKLKAYLQSRGVQQMKKGGKWIPNDLHKGRCKNPGSPECPKGSPQYNLAMTFKKHHGFQKAEYGAGIPETDGNSSAKDAWVEAEGGEMYQQPDGQVMKIADDAPSHEQGGVPLQNVDKVLEDTSTSRADEVSKSLRITPTNFKAMFGFNAGRTVSHSEALDLVDKYYQKKANKYGGKINASLETLNKYPDNVYANNSLTLNTQAVSSLPTRDHAFNYLFQHQENVKQMMGADNSAQAAIGWGDDNTPYEGGNTSQRTKYNLPISIEQLNRKWQQAAGIDGTNMDNKTFQSKIYDWALQNDPEQIRNIWKQWKNTNQGKRLGIGKNYDFNNLSDEQLANLKSAYVDGSLGARTLIPKQNYNTVPIDMPQPGYPAPPDSLNGTPNINVNGTPPVVDNVPQPSPDYKVNPAKPSRFNEPLHWYDLAGPLMTLASASRIPAKYNPAKFNEVRLKLQNPEPALEAGQQQYNQATSLIPTNSQTVLPQLYAAKYAQDNQILGQYQNINSGIKNQEVMYNANVRDRQSQSDQQSRGVFEQQMLGSLEAERQQKLSAFDDLFTRIALNRKLNREGSLLMQLSPNYNQYGQYNGQQRYLTSGVNSGIGGQGNGLNFSTQYDENGNAYRVAYDKNGKLVSSSKIITDDKRIGATGR